MVKIEKIIEVCCHQVKYWYDIGRMKQTDELLEALESGAEERAKECIIEGIVSGELNTVWNGDREIRGWWKIVRD